jgi:hypothetical protein
MPGRARWHALCDHVGADGPDGEAGKERRMSEVRQAGGLQLEQDIAFQERSWVVQRVAWGVMALAALAAFAGLFGAGPLSRATAGALGDPVRAEYQLFLRFQAPTSLTVELNPTAARDGEFRVWLARDYAEAVRVQEVVPPPERVEAGSDRLIYVFLAAPAGGPAGVTFHLQPERIGPLTGRLGLPDGPTLSFSHFVYP